MWSTFVALGDSLAEGWGDPAGGQRPRSWNDWVADGLRARGDLVRYVNLGDLNAVVRSVSVDLGAVVLDFESFAPAAEPAAMSADQVHPSARGYLLMGQVALQRLLARRQPRT